MIELGRMLFHDPRLSASQKMSCASCHPMNRAGADGIALSIGSNEQPVRRNAQTVFNTALQIAQFWDGRSATVEDQAKVPIVSEQEMDMPDASLVVAVLNSIPDYKALFLRAFPGDPDPINYDNIGAAIGAFERMLLTPARFDRFLRGERDQLNEQEQRGLQTFIALGCTSCHMGVPVGGLLFKKLGEIYPYATADQGRFEVTGLEEDRYVFKVPSLRNVTRTAPYLHDGSVATLDAIVRIMAWYQLGKEVTDEQVADVSAFLDTLSGDPPSAYLAVPNLPPSGPATEKILAARP